MESSSSKNRTQGAAALALSNTSLTFASDSPNHIVSSSGPWGKQTLVIIPQSVVVVYKHYRLQTSEHIHTKSTPYTQHILARAGSLPSSIDIINHGKSAAYTQLVTVYTAFLHCTSGKTTICKHFPSVLFFADNHCYTEIHI